jgi:RNA polymerase sigma factor (sigma-70 family)
MSRFGVVVCADPLPSPLPITQPCGALAPSRRCALDEAAPTPGHERCAPGFEPYALLDRYEPLVVSIARQLGRRRNLPLSQEDLVQSGRLTLIELATSAHATALNEAFVWTRLRNAMIDACRSQGWLGRRYKQDTPARHVELLSHERLEELPALTQEPATPDDHALRSVVRDAIAALPEQDQALLLQHDLAQIPLAQLAHETRRSRSCMSRRRTRALHALRQILQERGVHSIKDLI